MGDHVANLSLARRQLIHLMSEVGFGRLEAFPIRGGEPVLDERPRVVLELRVPAGGGTRKQPPTAGFAVKGAVGELLDQFTRIGDAWVEWIEVRDGLPVRVALVRQNGNEGGGAAGADARSSRSAIGGRGQ